MTTPYLAGILAADHGADLSRQASTARLAALARCCRPDAWARAARRATRAVLRLGIVVRPATPTVACCGPA